MNPSEVNNQIDTVIVVLISLTVLGFIVAAIINIVRDFPEPKPKPKKTVREPIRISDEAVEAKKQEFETKLMLDKLYYVRVTMLDGSEVHTDVLKGRYEVYKSKYGLSDGDEYLSNMFWSSYDAAKDLIQYQGDMLVGDKSITYHSIKMKEVVAV